MIQPITRGRAGPSVGPAHSASYVLGSKTVPRVMVCRSPGSRRLRVSLKTAPSATEDADLHRSRIASGGGLHIEGEHLTGH